MRRLLILLTMAAIISGCAIASEDYRPGLPGVRDAPPADTYVGRSGTVTDWVPGSSR